MAYPLFGAKPLFEEILVFWTGGDKLQWNLNQNTTIFIHVTNDVENIVLKNAAIIITWYNGCSHNGNKFIYRGIIVNSWKILDGCKKNRTSLILQSAFSHFTQPIGTAAVDSSLVDTAIAAELLSSWQLYSVQSPQYPLSLHVSSMSASTAFTDYRGIQMESVCWPLLLRHYGIEVNINISKPRQMAAILQIAFSNSLFNGNHCILLQLAPNDLIIQ